MSSPSLFDSLQTEFCPALDSSLIAALVAEIEHDASGSPHTPTPAQIADLRTTLSQLAVIAEAEEAEEADFNLAAAASTGAIGATTRGGGGRRRSGNAANSEWTSSSLDRDEDEGEEGGTTLSSWTTPPNDDYDSVQSFPSSSSSSLTSALSFLQTALPEIPAPRLRKALEEFKSNSSDGDGGEGEGDDESELDMWDLIATILTEEYIREREERGVDGLDEDDRFALGYGNGDELEEGAGEEEEMGWEVFTTRKTTKKKKKNSRNSNGGNVKTLQGKTGGTKTTTTSKTKKKIILSDIRQQQHHPQLPTSTSTLSTTSTSTFSTLTSASTSTSSVINDPWTRISSISTHLASILPPHPASTFPPFFHSDRYKTPYEALRAALVFICPDSDSENKKKNNKQKNTDADAEAKDDDDSDELDTKHTEVLFNLLDIVLAQHDSESASNVNDHGNNAFDVMEERTRIISDVELAVRVTNGQGDAALDLVHLLRELDRAGGANAGEEEGFGDANSKTNSKSKVVVNHKPKPKPPPAPPPLSSSSTSTAHSTLPAHPPSIPPPPSTLSQSTSNTSNGSKQRQKQKHQPHQTSWQTIPERPLSLPTIQDKLAVHIPTYARDVNGNRVGSRSAGSASKNGIMGTGRTEGTAMWKTRDSLLKKRREMLREASRVWQNGTGKNRGGEVAAYFAERAREFQELALQEQLNATRRMVLAKRTSSGTYDTIDLHGATVSEAITIVKEILESYFPPSSSHSSSSHPSHPSHPSHSHSRSSSTNPPPGNQQQQQLRIITGKGHHSVGNVPVLKPAIKRVLADEGWVVGEWDAGVVVRGRKVVIGRGAGAGAGKTR